jgi:hypothetical protein
MAKTMKVRKFFNAQWSPVPENDPTIEYAIEHVLDEHGGVISETMFIAESPADQAPADLKA